MPIKLITKKYLFIFVILMFGCLVSGCSTPPTTISAAQKMFDEDEDLIIDKSTISNVEELLGSPANIKNQSDGSKIYTYYRSRNKKLMGFIPYGKAADYAALYTFSKEGILKEKNYSATPGIF